MHIETRYTRDETSQIRTTVSDRVPRLVSRVSILALAMVGFTACGNIQPWVKPYERAALAEPIMMAARDAVADEYMHHVFEVREGARGASGSAGGGCGCN